MFIDCRSINNELRLINVDKIKYFYIKSGLANSEGGFYSEIRCVLDDNHETEYLVLQTKTLSIVGRNRMWAGFQNVLNGKECFLKIHNDINNLEKKRVRNAISRIIKNGKQATYTAIFEALHDSINRCAVGTHLDVLIEENTITCEEKDDELYCTISENQHDQSDV